MKIYDYQDKELVAINGKGKRIKSIVRLINQYCVEKSVVPKSQRLDTDKFRVKPYNGLSKYWISSIKDSVVIICGCERLGIDDEKVLPLYLDILNELGYANNCTFLFLRSTSENPKIFSNEMINYENVKSIPDYSIVIGRNIKALCIGGGTEPYRDWIKKKSQTIGKKLYFEAQSFEMNDEEINQVKGIEGINAIITCSAPIFASPSNGDDNKWTYTNEDVQKQINKERIECLALVTIMLKTFPDIKLWIYTKYNENHHKYFANEKYGFFSLKYMEAVSLTGYVDNDEDGLYRISPRLTSIRMTSEDLRRFENIAREAQAVRNIEIPVPLYPDLNINGRLDVDRENVRIEGEEFDIN